MSTIQGNNGFPGVFEIDYLRLYKRNSALENISNEYSVTTGWNNQNERPRFVGDFNGDGKDDIIGFGFTGTKVSLSSSNSLQTSFLNTQWVQTEYTVEQGWNNQNERPRMLADINGDKKIDIVGFGFNGTKVSLSNSTSTIASTTNSQWVLTEFTREQGWADQNVRPRFLTDINGDGKADILGFGNTNTLISLSTSTNLIASFTPLQVIQAQYTVEQGWINQNERPRLYGDVNGDGKSDIVGFGTTWTKVSISTSGATIASFTPAQSVLANFTKEQGWSDQNLRPRFLADVNGDGKDDIVGFGFDGVFVSISTSVGNVASFATPVKVLYYFSVENGFANNLSHPRYLKDVNNDGKADIIGFNNDVIQVSISNCVNNSAVFSEYVNSIDDFTIQNGYANNNTHARCFGDITGDGTLDIIGFGQNSTSIYKNYCSVNNLPFDVTSSTINKSNDWDVQGIDSKDVAYKFYVPESTIINLTLCQQVNFEARIELFRENGTSTGYYSETIPLCSSSTINPCLSNIPVTPGYYFVVIDSKSVQGNFKLSVNENIQSLRTTNDLESIQNKSCVIASPNKKPTISPNPVTGNFKVLFPDSINEYEIYSLDGELRLQVKSLNTEEIDISASTLNSGLYIIKASNNNYIYQEKFIVIK